MNIHLLMAFTESRGYGSTSSCCCARSGNHNITGAVAAPTTDDDQFHDYSSSSTPTIHDTAPHYLLVINILIFKLDNITTIEHDIGKWSSLLILSSGINA